MNVFERFARTLGRSRGHYLKGLDTVFSTSGSRPSVSDDSAFIDLEQWGSGLLEGREPKTKKDFIRAFKGFVYICAKLNSQTVASQKLRLYVVKKEKTKVYRTVKTRPLSKQLKTWIYSKPHLDYWLTKAADVEEITDHVWLDLMKEVNPQHNSRDLKEYTILYSDLMGECYWFLLKNRLGVIEQIWPIPSQFIDPKMEDSLEIKTFIYRRGATEVDIPAENIVYFTYPNPNNIFTGFSCIKGVANAVYIREQMDDFEKALFENKARIGGILVPQSDRSISKEDRARLQVDFSQKYAGARKAGQLVIPPIDMKLEKDTMSPEEMSFIDGRAVNMEEICLAFDVPPGALTSKSVNLANAKVADYRHAKNGILPRCDRLAEKINEKVLPLYDDRIFCAFDNPVPQDRDLILKEQIGRVKAGIMTINEARAEQGLEEVEGGETVYIDSRLIPIGSEAEEEQIRRFTEKVIEKTREALG